MSYVLAGYGVTFVVLGGYVLGVIRRGRALARARPSEQTSPQ